MIKTKFLNNEAGVMSAEEKSLFQRCREIPVDDIIETYGNHGLKYISWVNAWIRIKEHFPNALCVIHTFGKEDEPWVPYLKTDVGYFVQVTVNLGTPIIQDATEIFPVMDSQMKAMKNPDARDISDAHQRALVKCLARHGFGLQCWERDHQPSESTQPQSRAMATPSASGEYRMGIPKNKSLGKTFDEMGATSVANDYNYWNARIKSEGKPATGEVKRFLDAAKSWLNASHAVKAHASKHVDMPPPISDEDIGMPF